MRKSLSLFLLLILFNQTTAQRRPSTEASTLAFTHVTVIDMTGTPPKPDMTVVVTGNRITDLGQSGTVRIPRGAQIINAAGKFLIPGLWDMHFHVKETERTF
ncbi:MAG TPA: hypothetical protein VFY51_05230, partial [Pyrinomonadaceae bacterium]|nr:hypothetical protein [Pyrinomonadaceae bacterium]